MRIAESRARAHDQPRMAALKLKPHRVLLSGKCSEYDILLKATILYVLD